MVDSELSPHRYWTDDFGNRAFWFDAFVSHNRGDSSESLVHQLRAIGIRVSSDHAGAPEGWPFPTFLFGHLSSSRCVVVSIGQKFRLSPWINAEVNAARRVQARSGLDRIFIAVSSDSHHVPAELDGYPLFDVSSVEGFQDLVDRLVHMNRLPAEMLDARSKLRRETSETRLSKAAQALRAKLDDVRLKIDTNNEASLWWLAGDMLVDSDGQPGFWRRDDFPLRVVSALRDSSPRISDEFGDELATVVRGMLGTGSYNSDERVWLLRLLAQAACGRSEHWDNYLDCLASETSDAVAKEMLTGIRRAGGPTGSDPRIAMAVLVATDISGMYEVDIEHLSAGLPEPVLARLQMHGEPNVDLAALSPGERMNLAAARMPASLRSGVALEVWLRELASLITTEHAPDEWSWVPLDTEKHRLVTCAMALTSIDWFIAYSEQRDGSPLIDLDADLSLWPILFSALHFPELSDYARGVAYRLERFFDVQARKADLPSDFIDYSGLLRAIFANWPSQKGMRDAVNIWRLDEINDHERREHLRALQELSTEESGPEI